MDPTAKVRIRSECKSEQGEREGRSVQSKAKQSRKSLSYVLQTALLTATPVTVTHNSYSDILGPKEIFSYTVENGYCDYHLMTFIPVDNGYCDYFALVPNQSPRIM